MEKKDFPSNSFINGSKGNDLCETSKELRAEVIRHHFDECIGGGALPCGDLLGYPLTTDVGGEDDNGIGEVTFSSELIVYLSLIHQLQKNIIDAAMRFLYLIEEHHGIGLLTNATNEESALFIANIAWRCTIEQGCSMFLLELRHIKAYHRPLIIKEKFGKRFG